MSQPTQSLLGGILMIAGTSIGAGMLGLPITTAAGGPFWTSVFFVVIWAIMTGTALAMLKVALAAPGRTNLVSLAHHTLGPWGARVAWGVYVLFFYCLMASYTSGAADIIAFALPVDWQPPTVAILLTVLLGGLLCYGVKAIDVSNRLLMFGLVASYGLLVFYAAPAIELNQLPAGEPGQLFAAIPLIVVSFGFHLLLPTLKTYLGENKSQLIKVVMLGSLIPLIVYLLWLWLVLAVIPLEGSSGLLAMKAVPHPVSTLSHTLGQSLAQPFIGQLAQSFSLFALLTSFFGVALSLCDFLTDGLKTLSISQSRHLMVALTLLPPLLFAYTYPSGFLTALNYGAIFGAILLVIFPCVMALKTPGSSRQPHWQNVLSQALLLLGVVFGIMVIGIRLWFG